ncbi:MAG TPA: hypothetical protein VJ773_00770 [Gemmatimonadales bacterium]|nr:hypothetical protein [Gemmatimonadales bacterium]
MRPILAALLALALATACRGQRPRPHDTYQAAAEFERLVDSVAPDVARVTGLEWRQRPSAALRSRDEVRRYLLEKVAAELPPERLAGMTSAYRLLGLLPDTLDLQRLLVDLYAEQVVGFYDPDSAMLFGVEGSDPAQLRLLVAHELTHALQDQYVRLDSILGMRQEGDRQAAAQAVLEGQAMIVSLQVFAPDPAAVTQPGFWEMARGTVRQMQGGTPVFRSAPLVLRESLLFPYLDGAEWIVWWENSALADSVPYGALMPESSEQILHPARYLAGDRPLTLRFTADTAGVLYEDTLGELELRILEGQLAGQGTRSESALPAGWAGDRFRAFASPDGPVLVWYLAWDDARSAARWLAGTGAMLRQLPRTGYRTMVDPVTLDQRPGTRVVIAPERWSRWNSLPAVAIVP